MKGTEKIPNKIKQNVAIVPANGLPPVFSFIRTIKNVGLNFARTTENFTNDAIIHDIDMYLCIKFMSLLETLNKAVHTLFLVMGIKMNDIIIIIQTPCLNKTSPTLLDKKEKTNMIIHHRVNAERKITLPNVL